MLLATFSSGPGYLLQVALAGKATDFTRDYVAAAWLADGKPLTALDGVTGNLEATRVGAEPVLIPCGPFHLHPPPASLLVRTLVPLGFRGAAIAWMLISVVALAVFAHVLVSLLLGSAAPPSARQFAAGFVALAIWPPTVMNLAFGQWSIVLATLVAAGWWGLERGGGGGRARGRTRWVAAVFGAAIALKTTPALLLGYLALRRRTLLVGTVGVVVALVLVSSPFVGGTDAWQAFLRDSHPCVVCWEAYVDNTVSINGILARLLVGGRYISAPFHAPALAHLLAPGLSLALVGLAAALTWRNSHRFPPVLPRGDAGPPANGRACRPDVDAADFAMWAALIALLNPLAWTHNALFLLLPTVLVGRRPDNGRGLSTVAAAAFVVLCLPRETLFRWAGPLPFSPARAWVLGAHAAAGLALFGCAAWQSLSGSATIEGDPASSAGQGRGRTRSWSRR